MRPCWCCEDGRHEDCEDGKANELGYEIECDCATVDHKSQ